MEFNDDNPKTLVIIRNNSGREGKIHGKIFKKRVHI